MCPADKSSAVSKLKKKHRGRKVGEGQSVAGERLSPGVGPQIRGAICLVIVTTLISWSKHTEESPPACGSDRAEETRCLQSCVFLLSPKMKEITARLGNKRRIRWKSNAFNQPFLWGRHKIFTAWTSFFFQCAIARVAEALGNLE